jgi:hypothetical protein
LKLDYIYDDPSKYRINYILCIGKYCLKDKFKQNWTDSLNNDKRVNPNSKNKLRTYRKFKSFFKIEPYLLFGTKQQRKVLTKFRIIVFVIYAKITLRMKFISLLLVLI